MKRLRAWLAQDVRCATWAKTIDAVIILLGIIFLISVIVTYAAQVAIVPPTPPSPPLSPSDTSSHWTGMIALICAILHVIFQEFVKPRWASKDRNRREEDKIQGFKEVGLVDIQPGLTALRVELATISATIAARHDEQMRVNQRFEENIRRVFRRLDGQHGKPTD